nr:hypothetical protein CFP56_77109 [Quercus suber]
MCLVVVYIVVHVFPVRDELFSLFVHHGGNFTENGRKYVGGAVDIVDNCDPDRWSKVEIESIYLVRGHQDIHVYVEHPIHEPILVNEGKNAGEGVQPLALEQDFTGYYDNDDESEHDEDDDGDEFYSFYENDDMYANDQTFNNENEVEVNANVPTEVAASQMGSRRVGKELEHPPEVFHINDSSDSVGSDGGESGLEDDVELTHGVRDFVEDSSDSWDGKDDAEVNKPGQMGAGVMNSDYESEELHSLVDSSSNDELGCDSDD